MSLHVRAKDWLIEPVVGHYTRVGSERGTLIQVAADNAGNPAHVLGDFRFRFPSSIPDGKYRLTIHWQTGRMNGTPWAFLLGTEAGSVREHQIPLADGGTISIRAIPDHHSDQWCTNDLAAGAILTLMLCLWMIDCLPNAMVNPIYLLAGGGLHSLVAGAAHQLQSSAGNRSRPHTRPRRPAPLVQR